MSFILKDYSCGCSQQYIEAMPGSKSDHDVCANCLRTAYIEMVIGYGRKWMLSALHRVGLKQGTSSRMNNELAELLWRHSRETAGLPWFYADGSRGN